jgi:hypothetical protein
MEAGEGGELKHFTEFRGEAVAKLRLLYTGERPVDPAANLEGIRIVTIEARAESSQSK